MAHADGDVGHNVAHDKLEQLGTLSGGYVQVTANQTGIGAAATDLTSLTVTVTVGSGRRIRVSGRWQASQVTVGAVMTAYINEGATVLQTASDDRAPGSTAQMRPEVVLTPSAGSHTYKLRASTGAGTVSLLASATQPAYILVEDIGT